MEIDRIVEQLDENASIMSLLRSHCASGCKDVIKLCSKSLGAGSAIVKLNSKETKVVIATNQSGVDRGYLTMDEL